MLAVEHKNRAIFRAIVLLCAHYVIHLLVASRLRFCMNLVILFPLPQSLFVYTRHGAVGSPTPVRCAVRRRDLVLLWGPMALHAPLVAWRAAFIFLPQEDIPSCRARGCFSRPPCPATFLDRSRAQCLDGCY